MRSSLNIWVLAASLLLACTAAIGCKNTAAGFGKDVENTGQKIQEKVN